MNTEQAKKKMGRPRKTRNIVFYKHGSKIRGWNPEAGLSVNITSRDVTEAAMVYDGLGFDFVAWGRKFTRDGLFNAANRMPFRQSQGAPDSALLATLESQYIKNDTLKQFMDTCAELFDGRIPEETLMLEGEYWTRAVSAVFIREAGVDGISRTRFEKPSGKIFASVNVLPSHGAGYNYTLEPWYAITHMTYKPAFCILISGDDFGHGGKDMPDHLSARDLANAILHSLWANKGVNSCEADVFAVETTPQPSPVASGSLPTPEDAPDPTPPLSSDPDAVAVEATPEPEVLPEAVPLTEADAQFADAVIPEATPPASEGRNWGEIKTQQIWLKGLTSSRELQAPATLARVLETVVSHEATARLTADCRAIADKKERNEYKRDNLHVWYPSAVFAGRAGGSNKGNVAGYTGLACLDFDGIATTLDAENVRDDLFMEFPEVLFSAVSASGLGVYALVTLDFDGSEAGYKAALSAAMEAFEAKGYMPDTGCVDPTRARYMSSDPDALSRPDGYMPKAFSARTDGGFILPASMLRECWTNSGRKRKGAGKVYLEEALRRIETAPEGMKDTTITSVMGSVARLIRNYGMDSEKVYERVRQVAFACGYDTKKTEDKIRRLGVKSEGGML